MVSCDGGGGPLGHPRIFINLDKPKICWCTYCGLPFVCSTLRQSSLWHYCAGANIMNRPMSTIGSISRPSQQLHIPLSLLGIQQRWAKVKKSQTNPTRNGDYRSYSGNGLLYILEVTCEIKLAFSKHWHSACGYTVKGSHSHHNLDRLHELMGEKAE